MNILWVSASFDLKDEGNHIPFDLNNKWHSVDGAGKFMYWDEKVEGGPILVIGSGGSHKDVYTSLTENPNYNHLKINELAGVGDLSGGTIWEWSSVGYGMSTPEESRPIIREALEKIGFK